MHLGEIEILYLDGGRFALDGGAMFGVVPKVLWEKKSPPDEKNRIRMRANSLLVRAGASRSGAEHAPALRSCWRQYSPRQRPRRPHLSERPLHRSARRTRARQQP